MVQRGIISTKSETDQTKVDKVERAYFNPEFCFWATRVVSGRGGIFYSVVRLIP